IARKRKYTPGAQGHSPHPALRATLSLWERVPRSGGGGLHPSVVSSVVTRRAVFPQRVVTLLRVPGDFRHVLWRTNLDCDLAPAPIELRVRWGIGDGVVIPDIVGDMLHQFFHFIEILREVRLAAGDFSKLHQIFFSLLG